MKLCCTVLFVALFMGCSTVTIPNPVANRVPHGLPFQDIQPIILLTIEESKKTESNPAPSTSERFMNSLADTLEASNEWRVEAIQPNGIRAATHRNTQSVVISVRYSKTRWWIKILDGRNVRYDGHHIHENAIVWVNQLEKRIRRAFDIYETIRDLEREEEEEEI